jgi:hypothetical protein
MPSPARRPRFRTIVAIAVGLITITACDYRPGRGPTRVDPLADAPPTWVTNPPSDARLIYAIGGAPGHDREAAIAEARKHLARQLHITIDQDGDEVIDDQITPDYQRPATLRIKSLDLPGVKIAKLEEVDDTIYVLLSFDRAAWAVSLRQRISELDARIQHGLAHPEPATSLLAAAAKRHLLLRPLVMQRDDLYARLLVADPATEVTAGSLSVERLRNELASACSSHGVAWSLSPELETIEEDLSGALARFGLQVRTDAKPATVRLALDLRLDQSQVDGMDKAEGAFHATVRRASDNSQLGSISVRLRASATTTALARERLLRKLLERWQDYLDGEFVECLGRL